MADPSNPPIPITKPLLGREEAEGCDRVVPGRRHVLRVVVVGNRDMVTDADESKAAFVAAPGGGTIKAVEFVLII